MERCSICSVANRKSIALTVRENKKYFKNTIAL